MARLVLGGGGSAKLFEAAREKGAKLPFAFEAAAPTDAGAVVLNSPTPNGMFSGRFRHEVDDDKLSARNRRKPMSAHLCRHVLHVMTVNVQV